MNYNYQLLLEELEELESLLDHPESLLEELEELDQESLLEELDELDQESEDLEEERESSHELVLLAEELESSSHERVLLEDEVRG